MRVQASCPDRKALLAEPVQVADLNDQWLWLEGRRKTACQRCAVRQGCAHGLRDRLRSGRTVRLVLPRSAAPMQLQPGDWIMLGVPGRAVLGASAVIYLGLLAGFLFGALVGNGLFGEPGAIAGAVTGVLLASLVVRTLPQRRFAPQVLERLAVPPVSMVDAEPDRGRHNLA